MSSELTLFMRRTEQQQQRPEMSDSRAVLIYWRVSTIITIVHQPILPVCAGVKADSEGYIAYPAPAQATL